MLLLAGTQDLPRHLNSMEASFWGGTRIVPMGLLESDTAADAIQIPLVAEGRSMTADAPEQVVAESHGYAFFLQVWGSVLWNEWPDAARPLPHGDVNRIRPRLASARGQCYIQRYDELNRADLAFVVTKLSMAFFETTRPTRREVDAIIKSALEGQRRAADRESVIAARDRLHDPGYIWSVCEESRQ